MAEQLDLEAIRKREQAATKGPWYRPFLAHLLRYSRKCSEDSGRDDDWKDAQKVGANLPDDRDADFIAHARDDVPALLAEVERLRAELARLRPPAPPAPDPHWRARMAAEALLGDDCGRVDG